MEKGKLVQYPFNGLVRGDNQGRGRKKPDGGTCLSGKLVSPTLEPSKPRMGHSSWTRAPPVPSRSRAHASAGLLCDSIQTALRKVFPLQAGLSIKSPQQRITFTGDMGSRGRVPHPSVSRKASLVTAAGGTDHRPRCGEPTPPPGGEPGSAVP